MNFLRRFVAASITTAFVLIAVPAEAGDCCCATPVCCAPAPVCCPPPPPPPVKVEWCVTDPITCCTYNVSACVPACCAGALPCLDDCRKGLFKRKILTYKFPCCGHCVDVVITKHGRTIVRD